MIDKNKAWKTADTIQEYLIYGLVFALFIATGVAEAFFYIAFCAFLVKKAIKPEFKYLNLANIFLFVFIIFCLLSTFNSDIYFGKSMKAFFFKWLKYIFLYLMIYENFLNNPKRLRNVLIVFLAGGGLISCDGLWQQITKFDFISHQPIKRDMIMASFNNENSLAAYLACVFFISTAFLPNIFDRKKYKSIFSFLTTTVGIYFILLILGTSLIFTYARAAWLGFLVGLVLYLVLSKNRVIYLVFVAMGLAYLLLPELRAQLSSSINVNALGVRASTWKAAVAMIKEDPFMGKGLGTFMLYFPKYSDLAGSYYAHNCFLQIWAESGIFALLSFLGFLFVLLKNGIKSYLKNNDKQMLGLICAIFVFLVHSCFDVHFYSLRLTMLFWIMAGILSANERNMING